MEKCAIAFNSKVEEKVEDSRFPQQLKVVYEHLVAFQAPPLSSGNAGKMGLLSFPMPRAIGGLFKLESKLCALYLAFGFVRVDKIRVTFTPIESVDISCDYQFESCFVPEAIVPYNISNVSSYKCKTIEHSRVLTPENDWRSVNDPDSLLFGLAYKLSTIQGWAVNVEYVLQFKN